MGRAVVALVALAGSAAGSPDCDTYTTCESCASASSWLGEGCRWCPLAGDGACHAYASPENSCSSAQEVANATACAAVYAPSQVHFAFAGRGGDGMAVSWTTRGETAGGVVFGLEADALDRNASGASATYLESFQHTAVLGGLEPATRYHFKVGGGSRGLWSDVFSFTTAKAAGAAYEPFRVAVLGDLGRRQYGGGDVLDSLGEHRGDFDFLWHLGDIGYADDALLHDPLSFTYETAYDEFMDQVMESFGTTLPHMVAPGNHEAECHSPACMASPLGRAKKLNNFSAYNARFRMPSAESGGSGNMWYSFDHGPLHVVTIDTETDFPGAPSDSYLPILDTGGFCDALGCGDWLPWLEADLKAVDRTKTPWVVVGGHRPLYSLRTVDADGTPNGDSVALIAAVEDLFVAYGVDLYVCGHIHAYERQRPIRNVTYIVTGAGGEDEGHSDYSDHGNGEWNVFWDNTTYGYAILDVISDTEMTFTQIAAATGATLDRVSFAK